MALKTPKTPIHTLISFCTVCLTVRLSLVLVLLPLISLAQRYSFRYEQRPSAVVSGKTLPNAFAGGLNACQFSMMKLDADSRDDLVVFDRTASKVSTFLAQADGSFRYDPSYEPMFPAMLNWMLLVDYDADGRRDLFTYTTAGIRLFRNVSTAGQVRFQPVADPLMVEGFSGLLPIYGSPVDIPAITDLDDDGDIDVLAAQVGGSYVVYYENLSRNRTPGPGALPGLDFKRNGDCWGNFIINDCEAFAFGVNCQGGGRIATPTAGARPAHSGITLTIADTDGDNRKDILLGHVGCFNVNQIRNATTNDAKANFVSAETKFPANAPVDFPSFLATFLEDIDGDGDADLLVSPNNSGNDGGLTDYRASNWFYRNTGTRTKPAYELVQKNFLQDGMIDLGENSAPALADLDGDGDADLLVGHAGTITSAGTRAGLWYFENKGTANDPAFELITTDYLGLAQSLNVTYTVPQLIDMDGNQTPDLVLTSRAGRVVQVRVFLNTAPRGSAARYVAAEARTWPVPSTIGLRELLTFADVDRDGLIDLLVGKQIGTVEYYRNTGSNAAPVYAPQSQTFGNLAGDITSGTRSLVVADLNGDNRPELVTGSYNGQLRLYRFPDSPTQPAVLLDSLKSLPFAGTDLTLAAADLDGDKLPDLVLGTIAGGLRFIKNDSEKVLITATEPTTDDTTPWAYPNPTDRYVTVRPPHDGTAEVINLAGQVVRAGAPVRAYDETTIDLGDLPEGTYLVRLLAPNKPARVEKVVIWR